ncbi:MAG: response regulator [bacterium]
MKTKILIADDEMDYRNLIRIALKGSEYEITEAQNGKETLEKIIHIQPDLVLLDINMPHMDGYTTCKKIRANPLFKDLPVIMLTIRKSPPAQTKGLEIGADDYILKPFKQDELQARIKSVLKRSVRKE